MRHAKGFVVRTAMTMRSAAFSDVTVINSGRKVRVSVAGLLILSCDAGNMNVDVYILLTVHHVKILGKCPT
jgi:hypothetical protein